MSKKLLDLLSILIENVQKKAYWKLTRLKRLLSSCAITSKIALFLISYPFLSFLKIEIL